jgi:tryptophanyl-tRNA synthetase
LRPPSGGRFALRDGSPATVPTAYGKNEEPTMTATTAPAVTTRLTGLQPTGGLHLGNLLGGIRPLVESQYDGPTIAMIADLHALTMEHDPARVRAATLELAAVLLAAGVDPQHTALIANSQIPEHSELHYLLECVANYGEAARMIQFKEKSAGGSSVRLSLLTYPVLMAADILLHDIGFVPVGEDQSQSGPRGSWTWPSRPAR